MPLMLIGLFFLASSSLRADVFYTPGAVDRWSPSLVTIFGEIRSDEEIERERRSNIGRSEIIKPRLTISQEIKDEDVVVFRDLLDNAKENVALLGIEGSRGTIPVDVELDSHGGSVFAAISLGRIIRQERVGMVSVRNNGQCLSSCVLILAGGLNRPFGSKNVGIHRPYLDTIHITTDEGQKRFYSGLEVTVKSYLAEVNVPESLYDMMMRTPPKRMRYLSEEELEYYNLSGLDTFHEEASTAKEALELGMTKSDYLEYTGNAQSVALECGSALGRGDILPEDLWLCIDQDLEKLREIYRRKSIID